MTIPALRPFPRQELEAIDATPALIEAFRLMWEAVEALSTQFNEDNDSLAIATFGQMLSRFGGVNERLDAVEEAVETIPDLSGDVAVGGGLDVTGEVGGATLSISGGGSVSGGLAIGSATINGNLVLEEANPLIRMIETDAAADEGAWDFAVNGNVFAWQLREDSLASGQNMLLLRRTGANLDSWEFRTSNINRLRLTDDGADINGILSFGALKVFTGQVTVGVDSVGLINIGQTLLRGVAFISSSSVSTTGGIYWVRMASGSSTAILMASGNGLWNGNNVTLNGTTGPAGEVTISADNTVGELQFENRRPFGVTFDCTIIGV